MRLYKTGNNCTVRRIDHPFIPLRRKAAANFHNNAIFDPDISVNDLFLFVHRDNLCVLDQNVRHNLIPPISIHSLLMQ
ncbi:hypothetical protein D3C79_838910 [compost metagenome]